MQLQAARGSGRRGPAARTGRESGLLRLCLTEVHTHTYHTVASTPTPQARMRRSEPLSTSRQGLKRPDGGSGSRLFFKVGNILEGP